MSDVVQRSTLFLLLLALSVLSGCSGTEREQDRSPMADLPNEVVAPVEDGLVLHYEGINGFAGAWWTIAVYADGAVIATTDAGLRRGRISGDQLRSLSGTAAKAIRGVGDARDCKATDLSNETFRLRTSTEELHATVYGLGCGSTAALKRLARFRAELSSIRAQATESYTPPAVLVWVGKTGGSEPSPVPPAWPLPDHPPFLFPNDDPLRLPGEWVTVLPYRRGGSVGDVYEYQGKAYWFQWRPVLPGIAER